MPKEGPLRRPPRRPVIEVREVVGPRGGTIIVLILNCNHWTRARKPAISATCMGCYIDSQLKER